MPFREGYVSEIVGTPVCVVSSNERIGRVADMIVNEPGEAFPRVASLVIKMSHGSFLAPLATVSDLTPRTGVILSAPPTEPAPPDDDALYLVEDLLDKQIVDVDGRKVVRINDIELAYTGGLLRVVAADVGISGLLRRLGVHRLAPALTDRIPRSLIAWNTVAPIANTNPAEVRLSISESRLSRLHPSDLAQIIGELSAGDAAKVIHSLDDETAADALEHLDVDRQKSIIDEVGTARAADIIEEMDSDDAADLLGELDPERQSALLAEMEPHTAGELRELVSYDEDSAGGLMTTDYVWIYPHRTVAATIAKIREIGPETEFIYYLYVVDGEKQLLGVLSLRTLLLSAPDATIESIMHADLVHVAPDADEQDVAATIARYDLLALPVLKDGAMLGIVTVDDAIDALIPDKLKRKLPRFTTRRQREGTARVS